MDNIVNEKLINTAIHAALAGARAILNIYQNMHFNVEYKSDNTPLTIADTNSNIAISNILNNTPFPVISEEGQHKFESNAPSPSTYWLVDPLDGTREFVKRNNQFCINIALIHNNQPVWGLIWKPVDGIGYMGGKNLGLYKISIPTPNNSHQEQICIEPAQPQSPPSQLTLLASGSDFNAATQQLIQLAKNSCGSIQIIQQGSAIKQLWIALGKAHCYPRVGVTMEWDTAAGQALIQSVGGDILDLNTFQPLVYGKQNPQNPNFICVNNHALSQQFVNTLKSAIVK